MSIWTIVQLLVLVTLATTRADESDDPDGLMDTTDRKPEPEYHVYAGKWTQCSDKMPSKTNINPAEVLVHMPRIGIQRRQVHCRTRSGQNVETMYCEPTIKYIKTDRLCIMTSDCMMGEWSSWRPRADGALVRNRHILQLPQGNGKACGLIEEVKPVAPDPTAHWSPGPWGPCKVAHEIISSDSAVGTMSIYDGNDNMVASYDDPDDYSLDDIPTPNCGGGNQRREAKCVSADGRDLHPSQCAYAQLPTLVQPCEEACPRDCQVGDWGPWTPCEPTDGCPLFPVQELTSTGFSVRRRRVTSAASNGGATCPPLEEKRSCASPRCASWQALPWGPCQLQQPHRICGRGKRTRELRCVGHDGKEAQAAWCSGSSAPSRWERCRIACAGDCVVSAWGAWSACAAECAAPASPPPTRRRVRHVLAAPSSTGWPCPSPDQLVQHEMCNAHACATYSWLTTPWGPCQPNRIEDSFSTNNISEIIDGDSLKEDEEDEPCIEEGEMTRDVMCVQNNADVVKESLCAPLHRPASRRACTIRCHRGCRVEAWGPWSECPNTCEPNKQSRVRKVHGGESCGSPKQSRDCPIPRSCHEEDLQWFTGNWSSCQMLPGDSCGEGFKVRSIWCGAGLYNSVDAGQCAGIQVPKTWTQCSVPCGTPRAVTCQEVCEKPLQYLDNDDPEIPDCYCKNITLEVLKPGSSCIMVKRSKCGMGYSLHAAICRWKGAEVPMAICRKYHSLTGEHSAGLGYNVEIPDLVESDCTVQCARDCLTGPWGEWGPCAAEAGSLAAFRFRSREVLEEGTAGGRECGATLQRATCTATEPQWNAGEWGTCVAERSCGAGIASRNITCMDSAGNIVDMKECTSPAPPRQAACRAPCPDDCFVSAWSAWSPCEQTKWGGRKDRTRVVLRPGAPGGAACGQLVEAAACPAHAYSWHVAPWEDCQPLGGSPCGEGIKQRSVRCLRSDGAFVNDSFCPNATATEPRESWCYVPCGVDCEMGEWSAWDRSACRCWDAADNYMRRTRQQLTAAVWPGRACEEVEQKAPCPREPCMRLVSRETAKCTVQTTTLPSDAPEACGWGSKSVMNRCELTEHDGAELAFDAGRCHNTLPGHIVYPPLYFQEEECEVPCGCGGWNSRAGPWGAWGPCRGGARVRSRRLRPAPRPPCRDSHRHLSIEWMNCTENDDIARGIDVSKKRIEKPHRGWTTTNPLYYDGYFEGSTSLLGIVWTATLVLVVYGTCMLCIGLKRCLRSRKLKTVTKV